MVVTACVRSIKGMTERKAIDSAVCSASIVLVAIVGCNLDIQTTGQLAISTMKPVLDLTESGFEQSSVPQPDANEASMQTSVFSASVFSKLGRRIEPLSEVPFK